MAEQKKYPKVSVIVPVYNRAGLILQTINSIQEQTYPNRELIILDDGSDDNTEEIIRELNDEKIHFVKLARSGIVGAVKNKGMEIATGELIAFNDSDDLWDKTKLEKQVNALEQYPGAGFCLVNGYNFKTKDTPVDFFYKRREGVAYDDVFTGIFKSEVACFTQTLVFRKECLAKTGFFKEKGSFSDPDFITRLASQYKAVILFEPLVFRRLHETNYIHSNWEKSYYEGIELARSNKSRLPATVYRNALFRIYMDYGEKCLLYKQRIKATRKFLYGWRYKPFSIVPLKKTMKAILNAK